MISSVSNITSFLRPWGITGKKVARRLGSSEFNLDAAFRTVVYKISTKIKNGEPITPALAPTFDIDVHVVNRASAASTRRALRQLEEPINAGPIASNCIGDGSFTHQRPLPPSLRSHEVPQLQQLGRKLQNSPCSPLEDRHTAQKEVGPSISASPPLGPFASVHLSPPLSSASLAAYRHETASVRQDACARRTGS